jgi:hypothetical protein
LTFEIEDQSIENVEDALIANIDDEREDTGESQPNIYEFDGNLVWRRKSYGAPPDAVPVSRALDFRMQDTSMHVLGILYERVDGIFVISDKHSGPMELFGPQVQDYFNIHHGISGTKGRMYE